MMQVHGCLMARGNVLANDLAPDMGGTRSIVPSEARSSSLIKDTNLQSFERQLSPLGCLAVADHQLVNGDQ